MQYTINELMVLMKALRGRLAELSSLRSECSNSTQYYGSTGEKIVTPLYSVKELDAKCVAIENFILLADTAIKQSNAITKVNIEIDAQTLMTPIG